MIALKQLPPPLGKLKIPPHSMEAEQTVIGSVLLTNTAFDKVCSIVTADMFYNRAHIAIFDAITQMMSKNMAVDIITLSEHLETIDQLEEAGGFPYLGELANNTPSAANCDAYAKIVKERYALRQIIGVAHTIADAGYNPEGRTAQEILADAEQQNSLITATFQNTQIDYSVESALLATIDHIEKRMKSKGLDGIATGFKWLDRRLNGLKPSNLIIVAARPAMGKSTFVLNIIENHALQGGNVYSFHLEMSREECSMKHISSIANIDLERLQNPNGVYEKDSLGEKITVVEPLDDEAWAGISNSMAKLKNSNLFINDDSYQTIPKMRLALREYEKKHGKVTLVTVDYLQLMKDPTTKNRFDEISNISRDLKSLSKEFKCPVIAVSQLSRKVEDRVDKRPVIADLRESGQIEQDANVIIFAYRDEYYRPDEKGSKGFAEINVAKQRMGKTGVVDLQFQGHRSRFCDLMEGQKPPEKQQPASKKRYAKGLDL